MLIADADADHRSNSMIGPVIWAFLLFVGLSVAQFTRVNVTTIGDLNLAFNRADAVALEVFVATEIVIRLTSVVVDGKDKPIKLTCMTGLCFNVAQGGEATTVAFQNVRVVEGKFELFLEVLGPFNGTVSIASSSFSHLSGAVLDVQSASAVSVTNSNFSDSSLVLCAATARFMRLGSSSSRIQSVTLTGVRASNNTLCDSFVHVANVTNLVLSGCTFEQQTVNRSVIDAVGNSCLLSVDNSAFVQNVVRTKNIPAFYPLETGAAIRLDGSRNTANIRNSVFANCTATVGGALGSKTSSSFFNLTECRFLGNVARRDGGALHVHNVSISSCVFDENRAGDDGGAIFVASRAEIRDTRFLDGAVEAVGGVIATEVAAVQLFKVSITDNTVVGGVGVVFLPGVSSALLRDTCICNNGAASIDAIACNTASGVVNADAVSVFGPVANCTRSTSSAGMCIATTMCPRRAPVLRLPPISPISPSTSAITNTSALTSTAIPISTSSSTSSVTSVLMATMSVMSSSMPVFVAESDDSQLGIAIGAAVGGLVLLGIIGAVLFFVCRAKNSKPPTSAPSVAPANDNYGAVQLPLSDYEVGQLGNGDGDYGDGRLQM
jgi:predicted outer membrane repeat protein